VRLKGGTQPTRFEREAGPRHFEREAGQYGPSVSRPIRSEMRRPRFAARSERANVHYRQDASSVHIDLNGLPLDYFGTHFGRI